MTKRELTARELETWKAESIEEAYRRFEVELMLAYVGYVSYGGTR